MSEPAWVWLAAILAGYLIGSIPFGLVLTRIAGLGDIRATGSGNIGATNVLRTGRKDIAAATLILDGGKGAAAALLFQYLGGETVGLIAGFSAVIGHNFPVWIGFKGGKGVATSIGVLLAVAPLVGIVSCLTWIAVAALLRISSLAALVCLSAAPVYALILATPAHAALAAALAILALIRHRPNIGRLLNGTEPRIVRRSDTKRS